VHSPRRPTAASAVRGHGLPGPRPPDDALARAHARAAIQKPASTALLRGLRRRGYEPQLTQALNAVFEAEPAFAADFVRLLLRTLKRDDLARDVPPLLACVAEEVVPTGRLDLRFREGPWDLIVELKIHAGYGRGWFKRYLDELSDVEHAYLVAITRDVPVGEPPLDADARPEWLGPTRWRSLLKGMQALQPSDPMLAGQWPLFLEVLEQEGSMGFTEPKPELFDTFGRARLARMHMEEFLRAIRVPLLQSLQTACGGSDDAAAFYFPGGRKFSYTKWGRIDIPFRVPAKGGGRVRAGLIGWDSPPGFVVQPGGDRRWDKRMEAFSPDVKDAVRFLMSRDFDARYMRAWMPLDAKLLRSAEFDDIVVAWAAERFRDIVESGYLQSHLAVEDATADVDEDSELEMEA